MGREAFNQFERSILLQAIDTTWREHLAALDHLRQGIHLRGYAQKNPKQEYKREAFILFEQTLDRIRTEVTRVLMNVEIQSAEQVAQSVPEAPRLLMCSISMPISMPSRPWHSRILRHWHLRPVTRWCWSADGRGGL